MRTRPPPSASSPGDKTFPLCRQHVCGGGYGPETHTGWSPRPSRPVQGWLLLLSHQVAFLL